MTAVATTRDATSSATSRLDFELTPVLEAGEPPEVRGRGRDDVRLLVSRGEEEPVHARFERLPDYLDPGDLLVVNTSATVAASLDATRPDGSPLEVHLSTALPSGLWLIELREPPVLDSPVLDSPVLDSPVLDSPVLDSPVLDSPVLGSSVHQDDERGTTLRLPGGATVEVLARLRGSRRLWLAKLRTAGLPVLDYLGRRGRPIRYRHVAREWPLSAYQTVFARQPGSAEMPSAARPFSAELVVELVTRGITLSPLVLHAGVSSLEGHEQPFPEWYEVPPVTAALVNATHRAGGRVVAAGTTVVRALETAADPHGVVRAGSGWTDLVVTPERGVRATDGLLTGWHEPESSHLAMLEAIAGPTALEKAYRAALDRGYRWHEFGDSHLILPARRTG